MPERNTLVSRRATQSTDSTTSDTEEVVSKAAKRPSNEAGQLNGKVEAMATCCKWVSRSLPSATMGRVGLPWERSAVRISAPNTAAASKQPPTSPSQASPSLTHATHCPAASRVKPGSHEEHSCPM